MDIRLNLCVSKLESDAITKAVASQYNRVVVAAQVCEGHDDYELFIQTPHFKPRLHELEILRVFAVGVCRGLEFQTESKVASRPI